MRAGSPIATGTWHHVMSLDITQCHDRSVPGVSQADDLAAALLAVVTWGLRAGGASAIADAFSRTCGRPVSATCRLFRCRINTVGYGRVRGEHDYDAIGEVQIPAVGASAFFVYGFTKLAYQVLTPTSQQICHPSRLCLTLTRKEHHAHVAQFFIRIVSEIHIEQAVMGSVDRVIDPVLGVHSLDRCALGVLELRCGHPQRHSTKRMYGKVESRE